MKNRRLLSTSSGEDKEEDAPERLCQHFLGGNLDLFKSIRFLSPEGQYGDTLAMYVGPSVQRKASRLTVKIDEVIIKSQLGLWRVHAHAVQGKMGVSMLWQGVAFPILKDIAEFPLFQSRFVNKLPNYQNRSVAHDRKKMRLNYYRYN